MPLHKNIKFFISLGRNKEGVMRYSKEFKDAMLIRLLPPNNESVRRLSKECGVHEITLRNWRDSAKFEGYVPVSMN
jgi:transposase-like protein